MVSRNDDDDDFVRRESKYTDNEVRMELMVNGKWFPQSVSQFKLSFYILYCVEVDVDAFFIAIIVVTGNLVDAASCKPAMLEFQCNIHSQSQLGVCKCLLEFAAVTINKRNDASSTHACVCVALQW